MSNFVDRLKPDVENIKKVLPEELKDSFEYIIDRLMFAETDADYWKLMFYGEWPTNKEKLQNHIDMLQEKCNKLEN